MAQFGISTHLFHEQRLERDHLLAVAASGFPAIELFATRSHFDYHDDSALQTLKSWLEEANLRLHSVHAPITDVFSNGHGQRIFSTAARNAQLRREALDEIAAALAISRVVPFGVLVVHVGVPLGWHPDASDNHRESALRSIEELHAAAEPLGVRLALEVMPNELSTAEALVDMIERSFDGANIGICMDVGHAHLLGDVGEAIETASEYLTTTHVHDNRGQSDDHLVPFQGSIDWPAAIMALEKMGYDGVLMFEVASTESPERVLEKASRACRRLESLMLDNIQVPAFRRNPDDE